MAFVSRSVFCFGLLSRSVSLTNNLIHRFSVLIDFGFPLTPWSRSLPQEVKGLPPIPMPSVTELETAEPASSSSTPSDKHTPTQTKVNVGARSTTKRQAPTDDATTTLNTKAKKDKGKGITSEPKKKATKESKTWISFGND